MMSDTPAPTALLTISPSPFWHCGRTIRKNNLYFLAALMPAAIMAVWNWGLPAARVMALCVGTSILTEALCQKCMKRSLRIDNLSAAVSGLLLAFLLPAASPWWLVMLGAFTAIALGKMAFGGLGGNPLSTPLVGWAVLFVSFPLFMDANAMQLATPYADPLLRLKFFGVSQAAAIPLEDLLLGRQINGLGAGQIAPLFLGGMFLTACGVIRWQTVLGFFLGVGVPAAFLHVMAPAMNASPLFHLCTGSVMLGGFFLATEAGNSPTRPLPMFLYGILAGCLTMLIRKYGSYADAVPFAILLANLLTPYFDMIRPKPFGVR